jgi:hypothetical protein
MASCDQNCFASASLSGILSAARSAGQKAASVGLGPNHGHAGGVSSSSSRRNWPAPPSISPTIPCPVRPVQRSQQYTAALHPQRPQPCQALARPYTQHRARPPPGATGRPGGAHPRCRCTKGLLESLPAGPLPAMGGVRHGWSGCAHAVLGGSIRERALGQWPQSRGGDGSAAAAWRWTALSRRGMVEVPDATGGNVGRAGERSVRADPRLACCR